MSRIEAILEVAKMPTLTLEEKRKQVAKGCPELVRYKNPKKKLDRTDTSWYNGTMIEYCLGFAFNTRFDKVILIKKEHPEWQKGLINGVGGKVESGETPLEAMRREFREETGTDFEGWINFGVLKGRDWRVHLFTVKVHPTTFNNVVSATDEEVIRENPDNLSGVISNLTWLVPMAKDSLITGTGFEIDEINIY